MKKLFLSAIVALTPVFTFAQSGDAPFRFVRLRDSLNGFEYFINTIFIPTLFTIAFLVFLWGIFKTFILGATSEDAQEEGKSLMLYSILGFVLMVSLWGIINLFSSGLGLNEDHLEQIPQTNMIR